MATRLDEERRNASMSRGLCRPAYFGVPAAARLGFRQTRSVGDGKASEPNDRNKEVSACQRSRPRRFNDPSAVADRRPLSIRAVRAVRGKRPERSEDHGEADPLSFGPGDAPSALSPARPVVQTKAPCSSRKVAAPYSF